MNRVFVEMRPYQYLLAICSFKIKLNAPSYVIRGTRDAPLSVIQAFLLKHHFLIFVSIKPFTSFSLRVIFCFDVFFSCTPTKKKLQNSFRQFTSYSNKWGYKKWIPRWSDAAIVLEHRFNVFLPYEVACSYSDKDLSEKLRSFAN